jgi:hypothetical protein
MSRSTDITQSLPDRLGTRFSIAFSGQEAAGPGDHAQHLVQSRCGRRECLVEQIGGLNFIRIEEQLGVQVWAGAPQTHQVGDTPRDHQIQRQRTLDGKRCASTVYSTQPNFSMIETEGTNNLCPQILLWTQSFNPLLAVRSAAAIAIIQSASSAPSSNSR